MNKIIIIFLLGLCGCASRVAKDKSDTIVSMQIVDRNGFAETFSNKDRLDKYCTADFLTPQPYNRILRVYGKDLQGKSHSVLTTYHPSGHIWQYLEIVDGRAHGQYLQWHQSGKLHLQSEVLDGVADIQSGAQASWVFHSESHVWDEEGRKVAQIFYEKGQLEGRALYYHPNGHLWKVVPYHHNLIEGDLQVFNDKDELLESAHYEKGLMEAEAHGLHYKESYKKGKLLQGVYTNALGEKVSEIKDGEGVKAHFEEGKLESLITYHAGEPEGKVEFFDREGILRSYFHVKEGKKEGEEWIYYPRTQTPHLCIPWRDDLIQGIAKTWYDNGVLESQRELNNNKKQGLSLSWYRDGQLMLMEDYENDLLMKGSYFKKGDKLAVSKIENGKGVATLYDASGLFVRKVTYDKGLPQLD